MIVAALRMVRGAKYWLCVVLASVAMPHSAYAELSSLLPDAMQNNLRLSIDLSASAAFETNSDELSHTEALGVDLHKVFAGDRGDVATLTLQAYLTRINNAARRPFFFDDGNDWELVYRILNANVVLLNRGRMNLRIGHFEIPYGLEHTVDTNGTLRDYTHGRNLGVKTDWGITINGNLAQFDYELGWSRGSGNEWLTKGDPYIVSGRIGTWPSRSFVVGVSAMRGNVYNPEAPGFTVSRERIALDAQYFSRHLTWLAEYSVGRDDGEDVRNGVLELDFNNDDLSALVYLQLFHYAAKRRVSGWERNVTAHLGTSLEFGDGWTAEFQWSRDLRTADGMPEANTLAAQIRYRF